MTDLLIRNVTLEDASTVVEIYNYYVKNSVITFETDDVSQVEMQQRITDTVKANLPWIVLLQNKSIIGFAYASKWKGRCAYRYSVESTVYLKNGIQNKGYGSKLLSQLLKDLKSKNYHTVMAGIALPNTSSVALHEKFGYEKIAHFKEVGNKFNQWIDVAYWQIVFDENK